MEFVPIILWKKCDALFDIIKSRFEIVDIFTFTFSEDELLDKLKEMYFPYEISRSDKRLESNSIKFIVLKIINPIYEIFTRKEHENKPLNKSIINFKEEMRKTYDATYFHSADYLNESQHTFEIFKIKKYITNERFININDLFGVLWLDKHMKDYYFKKIKNTPHYLYLNEQSSYYEKYTSTIDIGHSVEKFDNVIKSINEEIFLNNFDINKICISIYYHDNIYIIQDGLHRTCIYLKNDINYIKCKIISSDFFEVKCINENYCDFEKTK